MARPRTRNPASPKRIARRKNAAKALELRTEGHTYREIAKALGYKNQATAYKLVMSELRLMNHDQVAMARKVESRRLDRMQLAVWKRAAVDGDDKAINTVVAIMERRARMLGLDAPQKIRVQDELERILDVAQRTLPKELFTALLTALAEDDGGGQAPPPEAGGPAGDNVH